MRGKALSRATLDESAVLPSVFVQVATIPLRHKEVSGETSSKRGAPITVTPKNPDELRKRVEEQAKKPAEPWHERTAEGLETPTPKRGEVF